MNTLRKLAALTALVFFTTGTNATGLTVDASGSGDYFTVSEALQYAMPGDVITVNGGVYTEAAGEKFPISVPTDITITGTVDGQPVFIVPANRTAFDVRDEARISISNLVIRDAETGISIHDDASDVTLQRIVINNCRKSGIVLRHATDIKISACVVAGTPAGIEAYKTDGLSVRQSTLAGHGNTGTAVRLGKSGIDLRRTIIDGFENGIMVEKTELDAVRMRNNSIHACAVPFRHDKTGIRTFSTGDALKNRAEDPRFVNRNGADFRLDKDSRLTGLGAYPVNVMPANCAIPQGTVQYDAIQLSWTTQSEAGNRGWNIYRGFSAQGPFEKINHGLIPGAGTSASARDYSFYDENLPDISDDMYYYLEQVSADGNTAFSQTVNVSTRSAVTAVSDDVFTD